VKVSDRVAYALMPGAYAEYAVVQLADHVSFERVVTFINQGTTAHYLVNE
jgi:NADPH:quinone reductase-like Zn-dependent oxidoreductase